MKEFPKKTKSDKVVDTLHAGAQLVPFGIGSAISKTISSFWPQGFEKRKEDWLQCLAEKLKDMPHDLTEQTNAFLESEEGKTLLLKAAMAAISTHKREKHQAIRDVLLNTVNDLNINYDQKEIYVNIVAELEPYDIFLLNIIYANYEEFKNVNSYEEVFQKCQEYNFQGDKDEFLLTINKLKEKSLLRVSDLLDGFSDVYSAELLTTESVNDMPKFIVTDFAKRFMQYIEHS